MIGMGSVTYEYTLEGNLIRVVVEGVIENASPAVLPEHQVFVFSMPKQLGVPLKEGGRVIRHEGGA
jgi:hypothetical protein